MLRQIAVMGRGEWMDILECSLPDTVRCCNKRSCFRCGWEISESLDRIQKIRSKGLSWRPSPAGGNMPRLRGLILTYESSERQG